MHISGLHLYAFLSPNLNFYACRSKMLNVTLIHRTTSSHGKRHIKSWKSHGKVMEFH